MTELIFVEYALYLLSIVAFIKLFISEAEDIIIRFENLKAKLRTNK